MTFLLGQTVTSSAQSLSDIQLWFSVARMLAAVGVFAAFGVVCRYAWYRHRWRRFRQEIDKWFRRILGSPTHPGQKITAMNDDDWKYLVAGMLADSRFGPTEVQNLLNLGVVTAKETVSENLF